MEGLIFLFAAYFTLYLYFIVRLTIGFGRIAEFRSPPFAPDTKFSIVLPFRNEAENLPALLESIKNLDYPLTHFELILIDDFSTDESASGIFRWRLENGLFHTTMIENVRVSGSPKKDAIMRAIPIAANPWILTTDADCVLPPTWLSSLNGFIVSGNAEMVAGPISYLRSNSFAAFFQNADLLSLQGVTVGSFGIGKPFMCNGANFGYTKSFFLELGGFAGNDSVAGGDDVFLLQKAAAKNPEKIGYIKSRDAVVKTQPAKSWHELVNQRVRWASKAGAFENDFGIMLSLAALAANVSIVLLVFGVLFLGIRWELPAAMFAIKFVVDYALMYRANRFLRQRTFLFPIVESALYPIFTAIVAIFVAIGRFSWKGRNFKK